MSIAADVAATIASTSRSGGPRKVSTLRLWSGSEWTSRSTAPGSPAAAAIFDTTSGRRPSETFAGQASTAAGTLPPASGSRISGEVWNIHHAWRGVPANRNAPRCIR